MSFINPKFPPKLTDLSEQAFKDYVIQYDPGARLSLNKVKHNVSFIKRQIAEYQGLLLWVLANQVLAGHILEIGTAWGFSAGMLAEGSPTSAITTLNPKETEYPVAVKNLRCWNNVEVVKMQSSAYYSVHPDMLYDFIFVDGDHDNVYLDFLWWFRLKPNGLILFHDYSPDGSGRPCAPVYDQVNRWMPSIGKHEPDIFYCDTRGVGMAGFINGEVNRE